jgi:bifunctional DNase/RNase
VSARPSDAIALALRVDAELYVSEAVLEEAGFVMAELPAEEEIAAELEAFRAELDAAGIDGFLDDALGDEPDDA